MTYNVVLIIFICSGLAYFPEYELKFLKDYSIPYNMSSTVSLLQLSITPCVIRVLDSGAYELQGTVVQWDAAISLCVTLEAVRYGAGDSSNGDGLGDFSCIHLV